MTAANVMGYGSHKEKPEYCFGAPAQGAMVSRVQAELAVNEVPVSRGIRTAADVLRTCQIEDRKRFLQGSGNVVRVRTGEEGKDVLQEESSQRAVSMDRGAECSSVSLIWSEGFFRS